MSEEKKTKLYLTGLYEQRTKSGDIFYSGRLGVNSVLVFRNNFKQKDTDPDFKVYLAESQKKDEKPQGGSDDFGF